MCEPLFADIAQHTVLPLRFACYHFTKHKYNEVGDEFVFTCVSFTYLNFHVYIFYINWPKLDCLCMSVNTAKKKYGVRVLSPWPWRSAEPYLACSAGLGESPEHSWLCFCRIPRAGFLTGAPLCTQLRIALAPVCCFHIQNSNHE